MIEAVVWFPTFFYLFTCLLVYLTCILAFLGVVIEESRVYLIDLDIALTFLLYYQISVYGNYYLH